MGNELGLGNPEPEEQINPDLVQFRNHLGLERLEPEEAKQRYLRMYHADAIKQGYDTGTHYLTDYPLFEDYERASWQFSTFKNKSFSEIRKAETERLLASPGAELVIYRPRIWPTGQGEFFPGVSTGVSALSFDCEFIIIDNAGRTKEECEEWLKEHFPEHADKIRTDDMNFDLRFAGGA